MDLNLRALIGVSYLVPIALTLRKVYAPNFEMPEAFGAVLAKMDKKQSFSRHSSRYLPRRPPVFSRDLVL